MSVIKKETIDVRRIDTALIGGDFTGNARGVEALDIQTGRTAATEVASGSPSVAIGESNTASANTTTASGYGNTVSGFASAAFGANNTVIGFYAAAIGYINTASGNYSAAMGRNNIASGNHSTAVGDKNTASGLYSTASGYFNTASVDSSAAIGYHNTTDGRYGLSVGASNTVSADYGTAAGYNNLASGIQSSAIGYANEASGLKSSAIGNSNLANASRSNAIGESAKARIEKTTNICGPQIIRKDDGEAAANAFESFCGVEVILMSKEIDMKVVADHTLTLTANCHFWLNEIGIIATDIADLIAQPTVRYGITGDLDKHNAAAITTILTAAGKREIETPLVPEDGEVSLTGGITIAANATTFTGRFYWKGMFVEDE